MKLTNYGYKSATLLIR